jgi:hypothetical protein
MWTSEMDRLELQSLQLRRKTSSFMKIRQFAQNVIKKIDGHDKDKAIEQGYVSSERKTGKMYVCFSVHELLLTSPSSICPSLYTNAN